MKRNGMRSGLRGAFALGFLVLLGLLSVPARAAETAVYEGKSGPGRGKHVVLIAGDEEYRSEEALPMLAKILSQRHGFKCTVLFSLDPDGTISPNAGGSLSGSEALESADAIVMLNRFRHWPDAAMERFEKAYLSGKPIIALRTSTHAFSFPKGSRWLKYSWDNNEWKGGFGKQVLGETWVTHWASHKKEATRGVIEPSSAKDPVLQGVTDVFGDTDVYEAYPPADAKILVRGQALLGMDPKDPPAAYNKKRVSDGQTQDVNTPMMPVVWSRVRKNEAGVENRIVCTTMGAATDLQNEGLRRLVVNAVFWGMGLKVPSKANVDFVDAYHPTMYGFNGYRKGLTPADHAVGKVLPSGGGAAAQTSTPEAPATLALKKGDHIALVGNALPDRMQHFGWLETLIHARYSQEDLVVRNLAASGDEVVTRSRSENFGSPDDWLKKVQADVILAFFGFNESFKGEAGLPGFKKDLDTWLKETRARNYSGRGNVRIVLFSPIPNERHPDPNYEDPTATNARLRLYTAAMAEVARANGVQFVDLFRLAQPFYDAAAKQGKSLTINGFLLNEEGDRLLAPAIFSALFGVPAPTGNHAALRAAINEKSAQWHGRYRTIDGYNVFGGRSALAYQPGKGGFISDRQAPEPYVSNYKVMQEEMSQRDTMVANRDKVVWAAARGQHLSVDDSNLPAVTKVKSNKPGVNPDESHEFLGGEAAIAKMTVHSGMKVNLFASEEQFPELSKPLQMAWDTKGRLWVSVWPNYPERTPDSKKGDSLLIFEDTDGDGKADKVTHYLDNLNAPTGFQFYKDGVMVMQAPDFWFVRDTNKDGRADSMERMLMGLDSADSHHTANAICMDPGGAMYLSDGVFHRTQVETAQGPLRNSDAAIYRYEPRTARFETYIPYGFANPHGRVFDAWGNDLVTDATGNNTVYGPAVSGRLDYPAKHPGIKDFWNRPSRPCPGTGILSSRHFPEEFQGNFLNINVISFQGIYRVKVTEDGSGLKGETLENLVSSTDPNFRPICISMGPDGAIYFCDWHNPIIGHMQHHLRDPSRDKVHGRIYRMTYEGRPLLKAPKIDGQPIPALLGLLKEPENGTRELAKIELGGRKSSDVIPAVKKWIASLDPKDPSYEHHVLEGLWVHQWHNVVDPDLLKRVLQSPDPRARAAAARVLCYWRDRVPDALALFRGLAEDSSPRVRLEAVRAASFYQGVEATDVALAVLKQPMDYYLDYVLKETLRQLEKTWRPALVSGQTIAQGNPLGQNRLLSTLTAAELVKLPRSETVLSMLVARTELADSDRATALADLAGLRNAGRAQVLMDLVERRAKGDDRVGPSMARLLPWLPPAELKPVRSRIADLTGSTNPEMRAAAWAALAVSDENYDAVWAEASKTSDGLASLLAGIPLISNPDYRSKAFDKVFPLLALDAQGLDSGIRRAAIRAAVSMNTDPAAVFTALARLIQKGRYVTTAAQGLRVLPRASWPKEQAGEVAVSLVAWAKGLATADRSGQEYAETIQFAGDLAVNLPADKVTAVRADLKGLRVPVFVIRTVREQMRYDTPRLVVEAGKPFELIVENADFMPHNLVVVRPGTREKVGTTAAAMKPDQLDARGRAYVPWMDEILGGTKLLESGQRETLKLTAPQVEGDHEYVCTFPGHHQVMWGWLIVTRDVDGYLASHPDFKLPGAPSMDEDGVPDHAHGKK